jgi:hypothetical protein
MDTTIPTGALIYDHRLQQYQIVMGPVEGGEAYSVSRCDRRGKLLGSAPDRSAAELLEARAGTSRYLVYLGTRRIQS